MKKFLYSSILIIVFLIGCSESPTQSKSETVDIVISEKPTPNISTVFPEEGETEEIEEPSETPQQPTPEEPTATLTPENTGPEFTFLSGSISPNMPVLSRQNLGQITAIAEASFPNAPTDVSWSYDASMLAIGTYGKIYIYSRDLTLLKTIEADGFAVAFSTQEPLLAFTESIGYEITLYDVEKDLELTSFEVELQTHSLGFSPDGKLLVSGHEDDTIQFWNVPTGDYYGGFQNKEKFLSTDIITFDFSPDGRFLLLSSYNKLITLNVADLTYYSEPHSLRGIIYSVAYSPNGRQYAATNSGPSIDVYQPDSIYPLLEYDGYILDGDANPIVYSASGDILFGRSERGLLIALSTQIPELLGSFTGHEPNFTWEDMELSPDGSLLLSGSGDTSAVIWGIP